MPKQNWILDERSVYKGEGGRSGDIVGHIEKVTGILTTLIVRDVQQLRDAWVMKLFSGSFLLFSLSGLEAESVSPLYIFPLHCVILRLQDSNELYFCLILWISDKRQLVHSDVVVYKQ